MGAVAFDMNRQPEHRNVLIVGLGRTGFSVLRHLHRQGIPVAVADTRSHPPMMEAARHNFPEVELHLGAFNADLFGAFRFLVVSPGVSIEEPAIRSAIHNGASLLGDIELFARKAKAPVIAITGSNGKSTVTQLVGNMLEAEGCNVLVGGNIGLPTLDLLDQPPAEVYVLELSSFQLETTYSLRPASSVVLNLSADHMDRYPDLKAYGDAKAGIYRNSLCCVINRDDTMAAELARGHCENRISFGLDSPPTSSDFGLSGHGKNAWLEHGTQRLLQAGEILIEGTHNIANALAAFALVESAGITLTPAMIESVKTFRGLPHRMELVGKHAGVRWINDSKGTNAGATIAALMGLETPVVLIAGGQGKGADFRPLAKCAESRVIHAVLFGQDRMLLESALPVSVDVSVVDSLESAVIRAAAVSSEGGTVLFSPACASFDMFESFEQRGDAFKNAVAELYRCRH